MKLSKEEKKIIEQHRTNKKLEQEANTPKLMAISKEDLHNIDFETLEDIRDGWHGWYLSKTEIDKITKEVFSMVVPAGTQFVGYVEDGKELWYDTVYGIENMDAKWARRYLTDIVPYCETQEKSKE